MAGLRTNNIVDRDMFLRFCEAENHVVPTSTGEIHLDRLSQKSFKKFEEIFATDQRRNSFLAYVTSKYSTPTNASTAAKKDHIMGIPITGATREAFDKTKTEAGSKPFLFVTGKWTNYTAEVVAGIEIGIPNLTPTAYVGPIALQQRISKCLQILSAHHKS